jgi:transcriptional regulator GlxA family with amidase domain
VGQYDIILGSGGIQQNILVVIVARKISLLPNSGPFRLNAPGPIIQFIKEQAPGAKYILSVCTGSWFLAKAGVLNGRKATTNKSALKQVMVIIHIILPQDGMQCL